MWRLEQFQEKNKRGGVIVNVERGDKFFKKNKRGSTFIREEKVCTLEVRKTIGKQIQFCEKTKRNEIHNKLL